MLTQRPLAMRSAAAVATDNAAEDPKPDALGMLPSMWIDNSGAPYCLGHNFSIKPLMCGFLFMFKLLPSSNQR